MNIYKVSTYILLTVCAFLTYLLIRNQGTVEIVTLSNGEKFTSDDIIADYDTLSSFLSVEDINGVFSKRIDSMSGNVLNYVEADTKMEKFKKWNDLLIVKKLKPRAFAFGIGRINNMLDDIIVANQKLPVNNKIVGVRIYVVRTHSDATSRRKKWHMDLMFVPVLKDGNDYIEFRKDRKNADFIMNQPNNMLLNTSIPCPNNCHTD